MSAVWIYAVSKVPFELCLLSAALAVPGLLSALLLQKVSRSVVVSPCGGSKSGGPLSEKFTAYLMVIFQFSLGRFLTIPNSPRQLKDRSFRPPKFDKYQNFSDLCS